MSSIEKFADPLGEDSRLAAPRRVNLLAVLGLIAAGAGIVALYVFAGQRFLAIWSAVALLGWMFVAGAAKATSD